MMFNFNHECKNFHEYLKTKKDLLSKTKYDYLQNTAKQKKES